MFVSEEIAVALALRMIIWDTIFAACSSKAGWRDRCIVLRIKNHFPYQWRKDLIILMLENVFYTYG